MTFLQPILLYALPLILLPVLIHLLNRLRHRTQQWGAMRFLVAASRSSVNRARLKQFLILLFRTLAVLMLILFLARPLTGGWMGWALLGSTPCSSCWTLRKYGNTPGWHLSTAGTGD